MSISMTKLDVGLSVVMVILGAFIHTIGLGFFISAANITTQNESLIKPTIGNFSLLIFLIPFLFSFLTRFGAQFVSKKILNVPK